LIQESNQTFRNIELARKTYDDMLGEYGKFSRDLMIEKQSQKKEDYGMTLIAAITEKDIVGL